MRGRFKIELDLGFLGVQKQYDNIRIPHKKPKGGELTEEQKAENRALSLFSLNSLNAIACISRRIAIAFGRARVRSLEKRS